MRYLIPVLICLATPAFADDALVEAARDRIGVTVVYDPAYVGLDFPGGDVAEDRGVCSDVVIRALRAAHDFDLQAKVNADMRSAFRAYPTIWGLSHTDKNIDHRRVPNLETYLARQGAELNKPTQNTTFKAGDIVTYRLGGNLPHIGIVSDRKSADGMPLLIHNIGAGTREEDVLLEYMLHRHFRFEVE